MGRYFPIYINLAEKQVWVYGAGRIALRRIAGLLRFGASVTVAAPKIREEILALQQQYPDQVAVLQRVYQPGEIPKNVHFVLAATDDRQVTTRIFRECRTKGIPVNNASDSSQCDFYFPALVEQEQLVIGVTSADGDHNRVSRFCEKLRGQMREGEWQNSDSGRQN